MPIAVAVRFRRGGRAYYFDPGDLPLKKNDAVIAQTSRGQEFGKVVLGKSEVSEEKIGGPLKPIIRLATAEDLERVKANSEREHEALRQCQEAVHRHNLPMKVISSEYTFDRSRLVFHFSAEGRVDFRGLVRELASMFRTRIELRQIGVRDEAKMLGGYGTCGRALCCASFLHGFDPVAIRMAKDQGLSLNPSKISGACGRLMCCLRYEHETYLQCRCDLPKEGTWVRTPRGTGQVRGLNILARNVVVRLSGEQTVEFPVSEIEVLDGPPSPAEEQPQRRAAVEQAQGAAEARTGPATIPSAAPTEAPLAGAAQPNERRRRSSRSSRRRRRSKSPTEKGAGAPSGPPERKAEGASSDGQKETRAAPPEAEGTITVYRRSRRRRNRRTRKDKGPQSPPESKEQE